MLPPAVSTKWHWATSIQGSFPIQIPFETHNRMCILWLMFVPVFLFLFTIFYSVLFALEDTLPIAFLVLRDKWGFQKLLKIINLSLISPMKHHFVVCFKVSTFWLPLRGIFYNEAWVLLQWAEKATSSLPAQHASVNSDAKNRRTQLMRHTNFQPLPPTFCKTHIETRNRWPENPGYVNWDGKHIHWDSMNNLPVLTRFILFYFNKDFFIWEKKRECMSRS